MVSGSNAFKRYSELDFSLHGPDSLEVTVTGGTFTPGDAGNELLLEVVEPSNFFLTVRGFDPARDVRVSIDRLTSVSGEGAE